MDNEITTTTSDSNPGGSSGNHNEQNDIQSETDGNYHNNNNKNKTSTELTMPMNHTGKRNRSNSGSYTTTTPTIDTNNNTPDPIRNDVQTLNDMQSTYQNQAVLMQQLQQIQNTATMNHQLQQQQFHAGGGLFGIQNPNYIHPNNNNNNNNTNHLFLENQLQQQVDAKAAAAAAALRLQPPTAPTFNEQQISLLLQQQLLGGLGFANPLLTPNFGLNQHQPPNLGTDVSSSSHSDLSSNLLFLQAMSQQGQQQQGFYGPTAVPMSMPQNTNLLSATAISNIHDRKPSSTMIDTRQNVVTGPEISQQQQPDTRTNTIALTGRPPIQLYITCDDDSLSEYQCLVRRQIELFEAGPEDVDSNAQGRNRPIVSGQVGIRCRHCTMLPPKHRARGAIYYPAKLQGIYQAAQNLASAHLGEHCQNIPMSVRNNLLHLRERKSSAGGGKKYWADAVCVLGVYEDMNGLRFQKRLQFEKQEDTNK